MNACGCPPEYHLADCPIRNRSADEEDALERFFKHYDDYRDD